MGRLGCWKRLYEVSPATRHQRRTVLDRRLGRGTVRRLPNFARSDGAGEAQHHVVANGPPVCGDNGDSTG